MTYSNAVDGVMDWIKNFKSITRKTNITVFDGETQENIESTLNEKPNSYIINAAGSEPSAAYENSSVTGTIDKIELFYKSEQTTSKPDAKSGKKSGAVTYPNELVNFLLTPFNFNIRTGAGNNPVTARYISIEPLEYNVKLITIEVS